MVNYISAFGHYKLTKPVPNKSVEIAFLFIIHICKSAYLQCHVHEYSFNNTFFCKINKKIGKYSSFRFVCFLCLKYFRKLKCFPEIIILFRELFRELFSS